MENKISLNQQQL